MLLCGGWEFVIFKQEKSARNSKIKCFEMFFVDSTYQQNTCYHLTAMTVDYPYAASPH